VSQAIVDALEVVQVDEEDGQGDRPALTPIQRVAQTIVEQGSIWQAREGIVESLVTQRPP